MQKKCKICLKLFNFYNYHRNLLQKFVFKKKALIGLEIRPVQFGLARFSKNCENRYCSPSSDHIKTNYSLLDSPRRDASNGSKMMSLASIDHSLMLILIKIFNVNYYVKYRC
jgi:hypothetical protein